MNAIPKTMTAAATRVRVGRRETEQAPVRHDTADEFRRAASRAMHAFTFPAGAIVEVGDAVTDAARRMAETGDGDFRALAAACAEEWSALSTAADEHRKKMEIAEANAKDLLAAANRSIAAQVESATASDSDIDALSQAFSDKGVVVNVATWEKIMDAGHVGHLAEFLRRNMTVDGDTFRHRSALVALKNSIGISGSRW